MAHPGWHASCPKRYLLVARDHTSSLAASLRNDWDFNLMTVSDSLFLLGYNNRRNEDLSMSEIKRDIWYFS